jgi:hypothetical protein
MLGKEEGRGQPGLSPRLEHAVKLAQHGEWIGHVLHHLGAEHQVVRRVGYGDGREVAHVVDRRVRLLGDLAEVGRLIGQVIEQPAKRCLSRARVQHPKVLRAALSGSLLGEFAQPVARGIR